MSVVPPEKIPKEVRIRVRQARHTLITYSANSQELTAKGSKLVTQSLLQVDAEGTGYACAVAGVGMVAVAYVALLDEELGIAHGTCRVGKEEFLLLERHEAK